MPENGPIQNRGRGRMLQIAAWVLGTIWVIVGFAVWDAADDGLPKAAVGLVGFLGVGVFMSMHSTGARHLAPDADAAMAADPRPPVVYLRSFDTDDTPSNVEWALCEIMDDVGPFVAVGRPGDTLPPMGASRAYRSDRDWQPYVRDLMSRAALVVMLAGKTEGLRWELRECLRRVSPKRLVVLVPKDREAYDAFGLGAREAAPQIRLPAYPARDLQRFHASDICALAYFDDDWRGHVSAFPKAFFRGRHHEIATSSTRAPERLRLALAPVARAAGLPIRMPGTNFIMIGFLVWLVIGVATLAVLGTLLYLGILE